MAAEPTTQQYYKAFRKSYPKLKDSLPINDLLPELYKASVVSGNLKEKLNSIPVRGEKVTCLLDEMERGLKVGITDQFESFIRVMEEFGIVNSNIVVKRLAENIRSIIQPAVKQPSSSSNLTLPGLLYKMDENVMDKFYEKLIKYLPMDDVEFRASLKTAGLLPGDLKNEVTSKSTRAKMAEHFLDYGIKNDINTFSKLLTVMRKFTSGNDQLKVLVDEIEGIPTSNVETDVIQPTTMKRIKLEIGNHKDKVQNTKTS